MADQNNIQDGLESLIKSYIAKIDMLEKELKEKNRMLNGHNYRREIVQKTEK